MAVIAAVTSPRMDLVAEFYRFHVLLRGEIVTDRLLHGMTLLAVILDSECLFPVMTESAGKTIFHLGHGKTPVALFGDESLVVTIIASI